MSAGIPASTISTGVRDAFLAALQQRHDAGLPVRFWLRDDDAVQPGEALDHLLAITQQRGIPLTLAVIPAFSGEALAQRLSPLARVNVAVHGWAHLNHAPATEKKQELGTHRPLQQTCDELQRGLHHLQALHGAQCVALLVPPWNRIAAPLIPLLPAIGFKAVSTFDRISFESMPMINTHVDIIDWKGSRPVDTPGRAEPAQSADAERRRGAASSREQIRPTRPADELITQITRRLLDACELTGILTHHLVHEPAAWAFLEQLFELTASHPAVQWIAVRDLLSVQRPDPGLPGQQQA